MIILRIIFVIYAIFFCGCGRSKSARRQTNLVSHTSSKLWAKIDILSLIAKSEVLKSCDKSSCEYEFTFPDELKPILMRIADEGRVPGMYESIPSEKNNLIMGQKLIVDETISRKLVFVEFHPKKLSGNINWIDNVAYVRISPQAVFSTTDFDSVFDSERILFTYDSLPDNGKEFIAKIYFKNNNLLSKSHDQISN